MSEVIPKHMGKYLITAPQLQQNINVFLAILDPYRFFNRTQDPIVSFQRNAQMPKVNKNLQYASKTQHLFFKKQRARVH